jgi:hypothetical protein
MEETIVIPWQGAPRNGRSHLFFATQSKRHGFDNETSGGRDEFIATYSPSKAKAATGPGGKNLSTSVESNKKSVGPDRAQRWKKHFRIQGLRKHS